MTAHPQGLLCLLLAAALAPAAGSLAAETFEFRLTSTTNTQQSMNFVWCRPGASTSPVPPGVVSARAIVFRDADLPTPAPVVADEAKGTGTGYTHLRVDLDGNGQLDPNESLALIAHGSKFLEIPPFVCRVADAGHRHNVTFYGSLNLMNPEPMLDLCTRLAYEGTGRLTDRDVWLSLRDNNGNGRVADTTNNLLSGEGAVLAFSILPDASQTNQLAFARAIGLFGRTYTTAVAFEGGEDSPTAVLKLTETNPPKGVLTFAGSNVLSIALVDPTNEMAVLVQVAGDRAEVPVGIWQAKDVTVREADCSFRADLRYGRAQESLVIREGAMASLQLGGPLRPGLRVGGNLSSPVLSLSLEPSSGVSGEEYVPVDSRGRQSAGWILRRPGGPAVAAGQFEFG